MYSVALRLRSYIATILTRPVRLIVLLLVIFSHNISAQEVPEYRIKSPIIFHMMEYTTWPNETQLSNINLAFISDETALFDEMVKAAKSVKVKGRQLSVVKTTLDQADPNQFQVFYIGANHKSELNDLANNIRRTNTLLISNQADNMRDLMIDFDYKDDGTLTFEVNRSNIIFEKLQINRDLLLIGGTEVDVAELFRESEYALQQIKSNLYKKEAQLAQTNKTLAQEQLRIGTQKAQIETLLAEIAHKETLLNQRTEQLSKMDAEVRQVAERLSAKKAELDSKDQALKAKDQQLAQRAKQDKEQRTLLLELNNQVAQKQDFLLEQQKQIENQSEKIYQQRGTIGSQQKFLWLTITGLLIFAVLMMITLRINTLRKKAMVKAEEATNAKSRFLANMSHEIRTPLNAIIGLSKLTLRTALNKQQKDYTEKVLDAGEALLGLINDILDFSKIEAGKLSLEKTDFVLERLLRKSVSLCSLSAHAKGLELIVDSDPKLPQTFVGDPLRLQQIIVNLVNNAVKFTHKGSVCIKVAPQQTSEQGYTLHFSVIDTGIGMNKDQQTKLFKSFSQADESVTRKYGGTGLGLAISKQLCELMGGRIWLTSKPGVGTTFHFTVRLEPSNKDATAMALDLSKAGQLKALVVDDVELTRSILLDYLKHIGIKGEQAAGGREAIDMINAAQQAKKPFDFILMDWRMPDLDGIETSRRLHQQYRDETPYILMVTAFDKDDAKAQIADGLINQYLEKPVSQSTLVDALTNMMSGTLIHQQTGDDIYVPDFSTSHILLVEDNAVNRQVALGFLADTKVTVDIAKDGLEACDMVAKHQYDLVLMDVQMPEMDGLSATREIRNSLAQSELPIIAMTAHAMESDVRKSKAAGMNEHLTKPIEPYLLYRVMLNYLSDNNAITTRVDQEPAGESSEISKNVNLTEPQHQLLTQLHQIDSLNTDKALRAMSGKHLLYLNLVRDFTRDNQALCLGLKKLFDEQQWHTLHRTVHSLKSNAAYIGAEALSAMAAELEQAILNEQPTEPLFYKVCSSIEQLLSQLTPLLADADDILRVQRNGEQNLEQLLDEILGLLKSSNIEVEDSMSMLQKLGQDSPYAKEVEQIVSYIDDIEYEAAVKVTEQVLDKLSQ